MIDYLGEIVQENGAQSVTYPPNFPKDVDDAINLPPFTCLFFEDLKAKQPNAKIGEYRVFVPNRAIHSYKSTIDENCDCETSYNKIGDWVVIPNNKHGALWVYIYSPRENIFKGYLGFEPDIPRPIWMSPVDAFKICDIPEVPTRQQQANGANCPLVVNGFQGRPLVIPQNIVQRGVFDIVNENGTIKLVNPYCMIGDVLSLVDVSNFSIQDNKVLAFETDFEFSKIVWLNSVEDLQDMQENTYDKIIVPLYKFGNDGEVEIDFRGIPNAYLER